MEVKESISYSDAEGNVVTFSSLELEVDYDIVVNPETCPEPVELSMDGFEGAVELNAGHLGMDSLGRIVKLNVTVRNVCPNKRVALAAILTEVDSENAEHKRGLKQ